MGGGSDVFLPRCRVNCVLRYRFCERRVPAGKGVALADGICGLAVDRERRGGVTLGSGVRLVREDLLVFYAVGVCDGAGGDVWLKRGIAQLPVRSDGIAVCVLRPLVKAAEHLCGKGSGFIA